MGLKLHTIVAYLWWFQWVIFSRLYMGQLSWDGIKKWGIKLTLYLGKLEYCIWDEPINSIVWVSNLRNSFFTQVFHNLYTICYYHYNKTCLYRIYVMNFCIIFVFLSCFPTNPKHNPHTIAIHKVSLSLYPSLSTPNRAEMLAHFLSGLTTVSPSRRGPIKV